MVANCSTLCNRSAVTEAHCSLDEGTGSGGHKQLMLNIKMN